MLTPANIFLPPMVIQPFIENAIWHGLSGINDELRIEIRFIEKDDQLLCIIEDNGIGIERSLEKKKEAGRDHQAVGITNTRERIKVLNEKYNMKSEIIIEDKNGKTQYNESGTLVTIYLPLKNTVI
jgi:sensor histidine kinase YesM